MIYKIIFLDKKYEKCVETNFIAEINNNKYSQVFIIHYSFIRAFIHISGFYNIRKNMMEISLIFGIKNTHKINWNIPFHQRKNNREQ